MTKINCRNVLQSKSTNPICHTLNNYKVYANLYYIVLSIFINIIN